jgi:outer membrane receptor for ferrienterochelin and colicins
LNLHYLAVFFLLLTSRETGTGLLSVEVHGSKGAIGGALIRVAGREARADDRGRAQLAISVGTWSVTVAAEGFQEASATARIVEDRETSMEVELVPRVVLQEEVVVTATRNDRRLEDEPVRIEVVNRDDIEEKALMTPGSVAMLLSETTGLRVQTTAPALGAANVRIQGLRGRYSQLLSDGLPLYGLQGDSLSLLQVPPLDLGQVEIIKGAASALYGPSALGGVINLVSQRPRSRHRELLLNASSQAAADTAFWAMEPPHGNWAFTLLGGIHGQERQDLDGDGWADLPHYLRGAFRPRLFWGDDRGRSVFATAGIMAEDRSGGTIVGGKSRAEPFAEELDTRRADGGAVARIPIGRGKLLTLRGSISGRGERRLFGDVTERSNRITWFGEAVLMGKAGRHAWLFGGAMEQDRYAARDLPAFNYVFSTPGFMVQDEIDLSPKLILGLSGRVDHHSRYGTFASPRANLLYKIRPNWTARASAGTGFFAPTPFIEETEETGLSRLRPLSGLQAERARSASLDGSWSRGPFELVATIFGSHVRSPLERVPASANQVEIINAEGPTRTWGTELLARYRKDDLLLLFTHGHTRSTEENPEGGGRRDVPLTPRDVFSFNSIWESERRGRIGFEAYYVTRQALEDNPYRLAGRGYFLFGVLLEHRFGRMQFFVNMENLGDVRQTHYDPLVRPSRSYDGRWTVDAWAPLDGRVINGGVRIGF